MVCLDHRSFKQFKFYECVYKCSVFCICFECVGTVTTSVMLFVIIQTKVSLTDNIRSYIMDISIVKVKFSV